MSRLQFKFTDQSSAEARHTLISVVRKAGAAVRPLFPGDDDPELALVFVVEAADTEASRLMSVLGASAEVEYAETEPRRQLIR